MKTARIFLLVGGLFFFLFSSLVYAGVPRMINYQGKLTDVKGGLLNKTVKIDFTIYNQQIYGVALWTETHPAVQCEKGVFQVLLGSRNPIPDTVFTGAIRYLGIEVNDGGEMSPRQMMLSVPYAYRSLYSDTAKYAAYVPIEAIGGSGTAGYVPKFTASTTLGNSALYETGSRIGIGTTTPDTYSKLHVQHNDRYAGYFTSNNLDRNTCVLYSRYTGSGNYNATAVWGMSQPAYGYGFGGVFYGGYMGVLAQATGSGSGSQTGLWGYGAGSSGSNIGVYGYAHGTGTNYGVFGRAHDGTAWAGYFDGNAKVVGTLTKGGGSFQIDHPLDPENKYLFHSFVESPDMMNVYNGNVILDANGEATVELPAYFEALNGDFRYQLTCIGGFAPVYVAQEISGNQFTIAGGEPGMKVSWQVTGIRHDKFAEANRIQVEVDKPAEEQGKYLHPEAYKLGEEYDIHYEQYKQMKKPMEEENMD
jgi:hypothetical protein